MDSSYEYERTKTIHLLILGMLYLPEFNDCLSKGSTQIENENSARLENTSVDKSSHLLNNNNIQENKTLNFDSEVDSKLKKKQ